MDIFKVTGLDDQLRNSRGEPFQRPGPEGEMLHPPIREWLYILLNTGGERLSIDEKLAQHKTAKKIDNANGFVMLTAQEIESIKKAAGGPGFTVSLYGAVHDFFEQFTDKERDDAEEVLDGAN